MFTSLRKGFSVPKPRASKQYIGHIKSLAFATFWLVLMSFWCSFVLRICLFVDHGDGGRGISLQSRRFVKGKCFFEFVREVVRHLGFPKSRELYGGLLTP